MRTDSFEGPFDLLLYLVTRQKVDIGALSITDIADQYMAEIADLHAFDMDVASAFLLVASTLLEIKAKSLIPDAPQDMDEDLIGYDEDDARSIIITRLELYKQYKNAASFLESLKREQRLRHERNTGADPAFSSALPDFLKGISADALGCIAAGVFGRAQSPLLESDHIASRKLSLAEHMRSVHERLSHKKRLSFNELVEGTQEPAVVVVTFLSVLELYKRQMVTLVQDGPFGEIVIDFVEGSGELVVDDDAEGF
ncbi:MAG: segregation/condensation protein A [Eggerthellaceae bacterium]|nr:segregation/condensation protein A [Eggerthellaceae bacterium]